MGYADLIEKLRRLPGDKQAEVFDFVDLLSFRIPPADGGAVDEDCAA